VRGAFRFVLRFVFDAFFLGGAFSNGITQCRYTSNPNGVSCSQAKINSAESGAAEYRSRNSSVFTSSKRSRRYNEPRRSCIRMARASTSSCKRCQSTARSSCARRNPTTKVIKAAASSNAASGWRVQTPAVKAARNLLLWLASDAHEFTVRCRRSKLSPATHVRGAFISGMNTQHLIQLLERSLATCHSHPLSDVTLERMCGYLLYAARDYITV